MGRWRELADAWTLEHAVRVFERRGWKDVPGYPPVIAGALAHLRYRPRVLRGVSPERAQIEWGLRYIRSRYGVPGGGA